MAFLTSYQNSRSEWSKIFIRGLLWCWLSKIAIFGAEPLPLFVLVGQSNMTGADSAIDPGTPGQKSGDADILFWNRSAYQGIQWENDAQFCPLRIQNSAPYGGQIIGPEFGFARQMQASGKMARMAVVKVSFPSTSMAGEWQSGGFAYKALREEMEQAIGALKQAGERPVVSGFLVHQGISDALHDESMATNYRERLRDFIQRLRSDFAAPETPVVLARENLSPLAKPVFMEIVRDSIVAVADSTTAAAWIDVDDLQRVKGHHFTALSQMEIGRRYAIQMNTLINSPHQAKAIQGSKTP